MVLKNPKGANCIFYILFLKLAIWNEMKVDIPLFHKTFQLLSVLSELYIEHFMY